ncbi:hypothetical protein APHAL10511_006019 [Amanita phalloides]|nr:hypothetical protein APHAL10511_006019 [Amanita phalloides]
MFQQQASPLSATPNLSPTIKRHASDTFSPTSPVYHHSDTFKPQNDDLSIDPDELFTKCTISEVKAVQQKLRAEADHKKQELRVMVGERYRDILQASTSIISMADSSQKVLVALNESKAAILQQEDPQILKGLPSQKDTDTYLHTLQQLAAHVKLLIDAPENLWRLIERKKYFPASWLFLLVRVVHRALVRDDEQQGGVWQRQGVDVPSEFPLIQRQWDIVSQFRPQIIHKATLSLRDFAILPEDACAALVTLHLLDSRPLVEAYLAFLNQRTKTLVNALSHTFSQHKTSAASVNGDARTHSSSNSMTFNIPTQSSPVQDVKEAAQNTLLVIVHTAKLTREIFDEQGSGKSMMQNLLNFMQSDDAESIPSAALPPELCLTTPSVLATLPSPIQLQLLPPNLKTYKPYIDLTSSSSMISQIYLTAKLDEWIAASISQTANSFQPWLCHLKNVKDVWSVRTSIWRWVSSSQARPSEASLILKTLDNHFQQRVLGLWRFRLQKAEEEFSEQLKSALTTVRRQERTDFPLSYLFQIPPLPQNSQLGFGSKVNPFEKHYSALRNRLLHRTRLVDSVMGTLESCARAIQEDISSMLNGMGDSRDLVEDLVVDYRPSTKRLCQTIVETLGENEESLQDDAGHEFAFLYTIMIELAASSFFVTLIGCPSDVAQEFRQKLETLYDKTLDRWRNHVISTCLMNHVNPLPSSPVKSKQLHPSASLLRSLIALSMSTLQLGPPRDLAKWDLVVRGTFRSFVSRYLAHEVESGPQTTSDLAVLRQIVKQYGEEWHDIDEELLKRLKKTADFPDFEKTAAQALARCQNLLSPLLSYEIPDQMPNDKQGFLLPFGMPASDTQYQSALSVAKPGPRFGLLLVDGSVDF